MSHAVIGRMSADCEREPPFTDQRNWGYGAGAAISLGLELLFSFGLHLFIYLLPPNSFMNCPSR